ncbi:trimethylamine--corrinoid protein Co-methyltransferase [Hasllibacter halocynthiae]|uniref:Methyltransferase n=1 Tax=Hasllibacter halocynthiae TaxID=595589 RepID=A0A2T0X8A9_9RHOB|nr:trimethylamine methyltransferase family protein [Hasllibacter halocynthiae]PRY95181.1 trimethylamine--corrinoid protein Co-methyltransferase [Hasllibacter halocynthiae]
MADGGAARRGRRGGGGAARRAERGTERVEFARFAERRLPTIDALSPELLDVVEAGAETVLEEIGVVFSDNPAALDRWRAAGADVVGERVHLPKGLARTLCATAPEEYEQIARNPARNVMIGGDRMVFAPVYGPPFVRDAKGRRYGTIEDFRDFVKLGHQSQWLHHSGGTVCEPTDVAVNKRHLDMLHAHMTLTDKPFMGSVTDPARARDSVQMCELLFADQGGLAGRAAMTSLVNINSPLTCDATMISALEVYAEAGQACILSPFIVGGAMAPVSVVGTLTQVLAEVMAAVAYSQLVKPGAPVVFGTFVTSIDMNSGAPTFGTPEASQVLWGAGQLARRMKLPFRSGGALTGAKLPDAQAAYESANTLHAALTGGVNFMLHSCGWLEGGLVASKEKFVMDADQLGVIQRLAEGVRADPDALDAIREVGPGGHYLGCAHTRAHFKDAFWKTRLLDYKPFESWEEEGSRDTRALAALRVEKLLASHEAPPLDPAVNEALGDFVARRKAAEPDMAY